MASQDLLEIESFLSPSYWFLLIRGMPSENWKFVPRGAGITRLPFRSRILRKISNSACIHLPALQTIQICSSPVPTTAIITVPPRLDQSLFTQNNQDKGDNGRGKRFGRSRQDVWHRLILEGGRGEEDYSSASYYPYYTV